MKSIRTIVIDDDEDWRDSLVARVEAHPKLELIGAFESPIAAYDLITEGSVDLILLDIEMPEVNGVAFMKQLLKPPMVIFVTSYREFAVESYEVQAIDYLLKPLSTLRFRQAIEKVLLRWTEKNTPPTADTFFFIRENNNFIKIEMDKILFLKSMENYTQIVTHEQTFTTLMSLSTIEASLQPPKFQRVHRSYVVNTSKISVVNKTELLIEGYDIPLARSYADDILNNWVKSHLIAKSPTVL